MESYALGLETTGHLSVKGNVEAAQRPANSPILFISQSRIGCFCIEGL
jgi:hypothetical protein